MSAFVAPSGRACILLVCELVSFNFSCMFVISAVLKELSGQEVDLIDYLICPNYEEAFRFPLVRYARVHRCPFYLQYVAEEGFGARYESREIKEGKVV